MEKLVIYAAGSLRLALPAIAKQVMQLYSTQIEFKFTPAGLLYEKIIQESVHPYAHLFASANTLHPQNLIKNNLASSHHIFAGNRLCLIVRNQPQLTMLDSLSLLFNSNLKIGMSTPLKDPSGDYTFSLFDNIELRYHGKGEELKKRAKHLVGNTLSPSTPKGLHPAEYFLLNNIVDIYIGYANYAAKILTNPKLAIIELPAELMPTINYSIALLNHFHPKATSFINYLLSEQGQNYLVDNGFKRNFDKKETIK